MSEIIKILDSRFVTDRDIRVTKALVSSVEYSELKQRITELEQQLKTANGQSERLYISLQKTISITNKLLDEKAGVLFFDLADTRDIEAVINEIEDVMHGKPILNAQLLEAAKTGADWMRWWMQTAECECEHGHSCGYTERKNELEIMDKSIAEAEQYLSKLEQGEG